MRVHSTRHNEHNPYLFSAKYQAATRRHTSATGGGGRQRVGKSTGRHKEVYMNSKITQRMIHNCTVLETGHLAQKDTTDISHYVTCFNTIPHVCIMVKTTKLYTLRISIEDN